MILQEISKASPHNLSAMPLSANNFISLLYRLPYSAFIKQFSINVSIFISNTSTFGLKHTRRKENAGQKSKIVKRALSAYTILHLKHRKILNDFPLAAKLSDGCAASLRRPEKNKAEVEKSSEEILVQIEKYYFTPNTAASCGANFTDRSGVSFSFFFVHSSCAYVNLPSSSSDAARITRISSDRLKKAR